MKTKSTTAILMVCGLLAFSAGCSKDAGNTPPPTDTNQTPANAVTNQASTAAEVAPPASTGQIEAAKAAADQLADSTAQEMARIQAMVDTAKDLMAKGKYAEALAIINELSKHPLSPEQQSQVDGLKKSAQEQAAKAATDKAAAGAAKAIGGALGGN